MEKIEVSLGEADEAYVRIPKLQTEYNVDDGPQPEEENPTLWRYRTFGQLVEFLSSNELWFSHVSEFDDPYEAISLKDTSSTFSLIDQLSDSNQIHSDEQYIRDYYYALSYANCWHMNEEESAALWNQYGGEQNAVAIKSTAQRLRDVLNSEAYRIGSGKVEYDLNGDVERPVFQKRDDFRYEKEYRAVVFDYPRFQSIVARWEQIEEEYAKYNGSHIGPSIVDLMGKGEGIEVELDRLIEGIYVDPTANDRFVRAVRDVVSKFVDCPVEPSSLFHDPLKEDNE